MTDILALHAIQIVFCANGSPDCILCLLDILDSTGRGSDMSSGMPCPLVAADTKYTCV